VVSVPHTVLGPFWLCIRSLLTLLRSLLTLLRSLLTLLRSLLTLIKSLLTLTHTITGTQTSVLASALSTTTPVPSMM
jgi:hypothetical protein